MSAAAIWAHAGAGGAMVADEHRAHELHLIHGLRDDAPLSVGPGHRAAGVLVQSVVDGETQAILNRLPDGSPLPSGSMSSTRLRSALLQGLGFSVVSVATQGLVVDQDSMPVLSGLTYSPFRLTIRSPFRISLRW